MNKEKIYLLADLAAVAQTEIQKEFADLDPVIGIKRSMRDSGFPVDALTIDCIVSGRRIILLLHDEKPNELVYQFSYIDRDTGSDFITVSYDEVSPLWICGLIKEYMVSE